MSALISVIVPVYKVMLYLERCINSILAQTFTNFELILINDGSPDECGKVCDAYARKDKRIHVIHQKNKGVSVARNKGLDYVFMSSESRFLTFIDSDDYVHPMYLELLYLPIKNRMAEITSCRMKPTNEPKIEIVNIPISLTPPPRDCPKIYGVENYYCERTMDCIHAMGKLYPRSDWSGLRFPERIEYGEDVYTTYRAIFSHKQIAFVFLPLYGYFQSPNSLVRSKWSPKRLDSILGWEEQVRYFGENGYSDAARISCYTLFNTVLYNLFNISASTRCKDSRISAYDLCKLRKEAKQRFRYYNKKYSKYLTMKQKAKVLIKRLGVKSELFLRKRKSQI